MNWFGHSLPIRITYLSRPKLSGIGRHAGVLLEWMGCAFVVERQATVGFRRVSYEAFALCRPVLAERAIEDPGEVSLAFERLVKSLENLPGYDFFKRNCEHFARGVVFNEDRSLQVEGLLVLGGIAALVLLMNSTG
jgi:hypothetical protein